MPDPPTLFDKPVTVREEPSPPCGRSLALPLL